MRQLIRHRQKKNQMGTCQPRWITKPDVPAGSLVKQVQSLMALRSNLMVSLVRVILSQSYIRQGNSTPTASCRAQINSQVSVAICSYVRLSSGGITSSLSYLLRCVALRNVMWKKAHLNNLTRGTCVPKMVVMKKFQKSKRGNR